WWEIRHEPRRAVLAPCQLRGGSGLRRAVANDCRFAGQACEELKLDQLIFVPAALSPFKKDPAKPGGALRLAMLRAAIQGQEDFIADDCELKRPPPSYSIDTVLHIRERDPNAELFWLIGADNVNGLNKWHRFDALAKLVQFVVLDRGQAEKTANDY